MYLLYKFYYKKRAFFRSSKFRCDIYQTSKNDLFSEIGLILPSSYFVFSLENRILEIDKRFYLPRRSSSCRVGGDWYHSTSVLSSTNFAFIRLSVFLRRVRTAWGYYWGITAKWRAALPCRRDKTILFILSGIRFSSWCDDHPFPLSVRSTARLPIFICAFSFCIPVLASRLFRIEAHHPCSATLLIRCYFVVFPVF